MKRGMKVSLLISVLAAGLLLFTSMNMAYADTSKPIELKLAVHTPPGSLLHRIMSAWKEKVEEVTEGKVEITIYPAQSLVKIRDAYTGTIKGITDIAFTASDMEASRFPLNLAIELPLMDWPGGIAPTRIWTELQKKFPEMRAEYKDVKVLWHYVTMPMTLHFTKKKVRLPEDLKGLKIEAGGLKSPALKFFGATPMVTSPAEWYTALDRGIEDGMTHNYAPILALKVHTLLTHHVDVDFGLLSQVIVMNKEKWNSLPRDIQKKIDDIRPWIEEKSVEFSLAQSKESQKICEDLGHTFYTPTPEEKKLWLDGAKPVLDAWIAETEAKGLPGRAIVDEMKALIKKHK